MLYILQVQGPDAPLNELDSNGCTPLMYAAVADSVLAIEILLSYSAKREQVSTCRDMPICKLYLLKH